MNMQTRPPFAENYPYAEQESRAPSVLIEQDPTSRKQKSPIEWWYRLTAPQEPPETAPLAQRERARRGRLTSTVLFFAAIVLSLAIPIGIFGPNHFIALAAGAIVLLVILSSQFNRRGYTNVAGFIIPVGFNLAIISVILSTPLSPSTIQLYDILVFVEIFAASLLPPNGWVLAAFALANLIFIEADITWQHHNTIFAAMLLTDTVAIRIRPIIVHAVITGVIWLWVRSANLAIARADRAEVIANLEHMVAEQERAVAQQKWQLEHSIQIIVDTHIRVANGDLNSRVPLSSGNVLWQVAVPLNNLLARFQRMQQEVKSGQQAEYEFRRLREALMQALYAVKSSKAGRIPQALPRTSTMVDPLLQEIEPYLKKGTD